MSSHSRTEFSQIVFDFDGVLFSTKDAVQEAYEHVGISMPSDAYGKPWHQWMMQSLGLTEAEAARLHKLKNEVYLRLVQEGAVRPLPAHDVFMKYDQSVVATGASRAAASILLPGASHRIAVASASTMRKAHYLHTHRPNGAVYIDDDLKLGLDVVEYANTLRGANVFTFIHYRGQSADALEDMIING